MPTQDTVTRRVETPLIPLPPQVHPLVSCRLRIRTRDIPITNPTGFEPATLRSLVLLCTIACYTSIHVGLWKHVHTETLLMVTWIGYKPISGELKRAAVAEWISSWLAEQEDRGSIPGLATWIFSCFQVAIWLKYRWSDLNPQYNQPTIRWTKTNDSNWKNVVLHNHLPVRYSNLNIFILAKYTMIC